MKTIDRLMLKSFLGPMILSFFIVMFVLMMNFMWRYIDELVGKGLALGVIGELLMYATTTLMPLGLPLATLFASIMTMGSLGENYELLAMKSAGMSLPRIMRPLIVIMVLVSIGSFFVANNLVPYSTGKMKMLLSDIRHQKQTVEFRDGIFFNDIDNMSIRVGRNHANGLLRDILIYRNNSLSRMETILADSGYMKMSDDKRNMLVTLYNGVVYDQDRGWNWYDKAPLVRNYFTEQNMVVELSGFDFARSNSSEYEDAQTKTMKVLSHEIDSLETQVVDMNELAYGPFYNEHLFRFDKTIMTDSLRSQVKRIYPVTLGDSIRRMDNMQRRELWHQAVDEARRSLSALMFDEENSKFAIDFLYKNKIEWHNKIVLPVSILIFFLIGAALGAIIRKGGLGMPIIISVLFFVIYYIISMSGQKMAKEGTLTAFEGMWLSTFILLPLAVFLLYKATNDSNLFNPEWYIYRYRKIKTYIEKIIKGKKYDNDTVEKSA